MKHYIFNYRNFEKMGINRSEIKFYIVCMPVALITYKDGTRQKIHVKEMAETLNRTRSEKAEDGSGFAILEKGYYYTCFSMSSKKIYRLEPEYKTIECTCKDAELLKQSGLSSDVLCKHAHAFLKKYGLSGLNDPKYQDLVEGVKEEALLSEYEDITEYYANRYGCYN